MYFLTKFCSVCLKDNTNLLLVQKASDVDWKLSECLRGVDRGFIQQFYICASCRTNLDTAFEFRQTCLKSAATLEAYLTILQEEGGTLSKNLNVRLSNNRIPKQLLNDYKLKNTINPNVVIPSPIGAIVPGTNIILNPFSFYNVIPANTLFPVIEQPVNQTINFQSPDSAKKLKRNTIEATPNIFNSMPQLVIINPLPPIESPNKDTSTRQIEDIFKGTESEEMSVSVDPMAFDVFDDESNSYLMDDDSYLRPSYNNTTEMKNSLEKKCQDGMFICITCNAMFNEAKELSAHKKFRYGCRAKHFEKGSKLAVCLKCNRQFCTRQYLQKHIPRCKSSKPKLKQNRFVKKNYEENKNEGKHDKNNINVEEAVKTIPVESLPSITSSKLNVDLNEQLRREAMHLRCQFCNEKFTSGALLEDHLPRHYNYFKCSGCNQTFTDVCKIAIHMAVRHNTAEAVKCVTCNMEFRTSESIVGHSELHLRNLAFECHVCNTRYKNVADLNVHVPRHFNEFDAKEHTDLGEDFGGR